MRIELTLALAIVAPACSSDRTAVHDAQGQDATIDAVPARCDVASPFDAPVPLPGINSSAEDNGAWLSPDELRVYFFRGSSPIAPDSRDLYVASRPSTAEAFGTATPVAGVNTSTAEAQPSLTADELTMFLVRDSTTNIYVASRADSSASFSAPTAVSSINLQSEYDDSPWITSDGLTLYFASTRSGNFNYEIYVATRASPTAAFSQPVLIASLAAPGNDSMPVVRGDALELFFATQRDTVMTAEGYPNNIWHATRASTSEPFGVPSVVAELALPTNEGPTWVSADGCVLVFTSSRVDGAGSYDLWVATRP